MKHLKLGSVVAAGASLALVMACAGGGGDGSRLIAPAGLSADVVSGSVFTADVCKSGPVGTYNFTASNSGTTNTGDVLVASFSLTVVDAAAPPVCTTAFSRSQSATAGLDPAALITVTELAAPGTTLNNITTTGSLAAVPVIDVPNRKVTVGVNAFHGATATFINVALPPAHCTFTQGWYKNHTSSWPAGALTPNTVWDGGQTIINLFNTPPKGSQYIILAHQYITALLNIQGGSTVTPAVQTALDTAAAYFAGGGPGAGDPNVDITGVSTILDNYNNGLVGPGHCN